MVDASEYHDRTNHTPRRVATDDFRLDRSNKPQPYKRYEDLPRRTVAEPLVPPPAPTLSAVAEARADPLADTDQPPPSTDPNVRTLCYYATGITKELEVGGRTMRFRAASCTGKLYHVDLYAVCGDCGALDAGVYHYDPSTDAFDVLREGDYRGVLVAAAGGRPGVAAAPVTFVATSTWWRNAWKYRERTYRHAFWDSGTILANLLATAHGNDRRAEVVVGFADGPVADLLGVDPDEEAPLELVPVGRGDSAPDPPDVAPLDPDEAPLSDRVVEYPIVPDAWRQSTLEDGEVGPWRDRFGEQEGPGTERSGDGKRIDLAPVDPETASARPVGPTIRRRGSLREFAREPISARKFATVLDRGLRGIPVDLPLTDGLRGLVAPYCLVHAVEGIPSGSYRYRPGEAALRRIGDVDREAAGHLALDQPVVGDAAANVYLMADVEGIVERFGNRGYRAAQLAGGIGLGRLYLATYAHRALGGRGFTFYDDLVADHVAPGTDLTPMTLFAFGRPEK